MKPCLFADLVTLLREGLFGQFNQVIVAVETGSVPIAEIKSDGVVADLFPAGDDDSRKKGLFGTTVALAENILFPTSFGAR